MTPSLRQIVFALAVAVALATGGLLRSSVDAQRAASLPARLTDAEFQQLTDTLSEPSGTFASDNLVSNEMGFQKILPALSSRHAAGGVYLGVGPEQNFTYIAALRPRVAFITDIRGENRGLHLLYKALFELAADRAEFVSLLFSRPRQASITTASTAAELFAAIDPDPPDSARMDANIARVLDLLRDRHHLSLTITETDGLRKAYLEFGRSGPAASYTSSRMRLAPGPPSMNLPWGNYSSLMQATDADDVPESYLSSEQRFRTVKDLEMRNLVIPVVGDFAGPIALRGVGDWLRARQATVSVFYLSNVEDYVLGPARTRFCANVAALPIDDRSEFIRLLTKGGITRLLTTTAPIGPEVRDCVGR